MEISMKKLPRYVAALHLISLPSIADPGLNAQSAFASELIETAYRLSEVDQPPRVIRKIDPLYPFAAKRKGIKGSVTLRFIVTREGKVTEPSVVKGDPPGIFDTSALKAILRWRFDPATKDGEKVNVIIIAPLKFKPKGPQERFRDLAKQAGYYLKAGEYKKAVRTYGQLVKLSPQRPEIYYGRGFVYGKWGKHKKAVKDYSKAIKLNPESSKYYVSRSLAFSKLNNFRDACADLKSACDLGDCTSLNLAREEGVCER